MPIRNFFLISMFNKVNVINQFGIFLLVLSSQFAGAAVIRDDYDLDDDGLIEIGSIEEFLAVSSFGTAEDKISHFRENPGCPESHCVGYELVADIDFNGEPFEYGEYVGPVVYDAVFEGNGHVIRNLTVMFASGRVAGVFSFVGNSTLQNFSVENIEFDQGPVDYMGGLAASIDNSTIASVRVTGQLTNEHYVGGLAGVLSNSVVINSHFDGVVVPRNIGGGLQKGGLVGAAINTLVYASSARVVYDWTDPLDRNFELGGLIGTANSQSQIIASFAQMDVAKTDNDVGNLIASLNSATIESSYVTTSIPTLNNNDAFVIAYDAFQFRDDIDDSYVVKTTVQNLKCSQSDFDDSCDIPDLLTGWQTHVDSASQPVWVYNDKSELPTINPNFSYDGLDTDDDSVPDLIDRFRFNNAVSADFDYDGIPDYWNSSCDEACQQSAGLSLDAEIEYPYVVFVEAVEEPQAGSLSFTLLVWFSCWCCLLARLRATIRGRV